MSVTKDPSKNLVLFHFNMGWLMVQQYINLAKGNLGIL